MNNDKRAEQLLQQIADLPPDQQLAALNAECADAPDLRRRVISLLKLRERKDELSGRTAEIEQAWPDDLTVTRDERHAVVPDRDIAGQYQLIKIIGEGGMGEVWEAKQTKPVRRAVAVKLIKQGMDSRSVVARFDQERQALALMDHPHIARVLDGGVTDNGRPYFVMELVKGVQLNQFCDREQLAIKDRLDLFVAICRAVHHAHQKGVIHRDLKPANILVTIVDGVPIPKIIDFGVAKAISGKLTEESIATNFGAVVGTLEYMAPEQAELSGRDIDTRADIYSLGVVLYELLTGLRPFDRGNLQKAALAEMLRVIREDEPSKPSTRLSSNDSSPAFAATRQIEPKRLTALLRGELDWVVMRCLEKRRERRYESAAGLARDVEKYLNNEPVEARPPSPIYKAQKFIYRNRSLVVIAAALSVAFVIGLFSTATIAIIVSQKNSELRDANSSLVQAQKNEQSALTSATQQRDLARARLANNYVQQAIAHRDLERNDLLAKHLFLLAADNFASGSDEQKNAVFAASILIPDSELVTILDHAGKSSGLQFLRNTTSELGKRFGGFVGSSNRRRNRAQKWPRVWFL